jgi:hypothetical protein
MDSNVSPAKSGVLLGVLFGVIMILEFVIMYVIGLKSLVNTSFGTVVNVSNYILLPLLFIYIGCNNYKKNINKGFISLSDCLKVGVGLTVIAALIYGVFNVIFNFIFPEFIDEMIEITKAGMLASTPNITSEQIEMGLSMTRKMMSPYIALPLTLAMYAFFGLIYSLIVGLIVKKDNPQSI